MSVEVNVFIHLLESIGRDILIQARATTFAGGSDIRQPQEWAAARAKAIDGLIVPRSWALDVVQRPPKHAQVGWALLPYLDMLYEVLSLLKFDDPNRTRKYQLSGHALADWIIS